MSAQLTMLLQENIDELAMLETLDNGKPFKYARTSDLPQVCSNASFSSCEALLPFSH